MNQEHLNPYHLKHFECDDCGNEFYDKTSYSPASSLNEINDYYTYCSNCVIIEEEPDKQPTTKKRSKDFGLPPQEASENLRSLEIDKRTLRKTGRIKQFNTSVSEEWLERLKKIAYEERLRYVEVLERALESYENQRKSKPSNLHQTLKNIEKQVQPLQGQISWKELELRINSLNPALFKQVGLPITYEVLKETLQEFLRLGREKSEY